MAMNLLKQIFGTSNQREISKLKHVLEKINSLEVKYSGFTDEELKGMSFKFKEELKGLSKDKQDKILEEILP